MGYIGFSTRTPCMTGRRSGKNYRMSAIDSQVVGPSDKRMGTETGSFGSDTVPGADDTVVAGLETQLELNCRNGMTSVALVANQTSRKLDALVFRTAGARRCQHCSEGNARQVVR